MIPDPSREPFTAKAGATFGFVLAAICLMLTYHYAYLGDPTGAFAAAVLGIAYAVTGAYTLGRDAR